MPYRLSDAGTGDAEGDFDKLFNQELQTTIFNILQVAADETYQKYGREVSVISRVKADIYCLRTTLHPEYSDGLPPSKQKQRIKSFLNQTKKFVTYLEGEFCILGKGEDYNPSLYEHNHSSIYRKQLPQGSVKYADHLTVNKKHLLANEFDEMISRIYKDMQSLALVTQGALYSLHTAPKIKGPNIEIWSLLCEIGNIYFRHTGKNPKPKRVHHPYDEKTTITGDIIQLIDAIFKGHGFAKTLSTQAVYDYYLGFENGNAPNLKFTKPEWLEENTSGT